MRNFALTIAGFDPSSGAGLTADIKTFEQHQVYGLSVCTCITLQTESEFFEVRWEKLEDILKAIKVLLEKYDVSVIKTGILPSLEYLESIVDFIHSNYPEIKIIVDPVFKSSTGFDFMKTSDKKLYYEILKKCYLIIPNTDEAILITGIMDEIEAAKEISTYCNVYLKGGHSKTKLGTDFLIENQKLVELSPTTISVAQKHGSGCVLSAAIVANLSLGFSLKESCHRAKNYIETILLSNSTLLAYHHV